MNRSRVAAAGVVVIAVIVVVVVRSRSPAPDPGTRPLPRSMAAIGDSITRAVAVSSDVLGEVPEHSWATGTDPDDAVVSHAERLVAAGALPGGIFNNAQSGATIASAPAQADVTVAQGVDYVLVLLGANDVCTPDRSSMTPTSDFEAAFADAMHRLTAGLPNASIYVVSIPDVYRLWEIGRDHLLAQTIWDNAGICGSILSSRTSDPDRAAARERLGEFNDILERVCAQHVNCRYDGDAAFEFEFSADDVGPVDHFHPSVDGQAQLADVTWSAGFWPGL